MKKRVCSLLLCLTLLLPASAFAGSEGSLSNFAAVRAYRAGQFSDVSEDDWFSEYVAEAFSLGLIDGKDGGRFDPEGKLTVAECVKLAARLRSVFYADGERFSGGGAWYEPYVGYAAEHGITGGAFASYSAAATRADFAVWFSRAFPEEALTVQNEIPDGAIPDVAEGFSYGSAVYRLYRAGVLTGFDGGGLFSPGKTIRRCEAAAAAVRMARAETRQSLPSLVPLTADALYAKCSPAVFSIEIRSEDGEYNRFGSGFFISPDGLAVTNCHVLATAKSARVTTGDGKQYSITGIYDLNLRTDAALFRVGGSGFPYLEPGDSSKLLTGATVYTIGNPLGLNNSISKGIISTARREVEGIEYIQIDAPISGGSSGGALLDVYGRVIGITSAGFVGGQNLNLAMPIDVVSRLDGSRSVPLADFKMKTAYYDGFFPAPDFGAYASVTPETSDSASGNAAFYYRVNGLRESAGELTAGYVPLLSENLFTFYSSGENAFNKDIYYNSMYGIMLTCNVVGIDEA
ncbi:MAG: trypsin-like peptidase domain-containing protein, partial [Oscillospiraceae bacterium]|nr:trypsin-like peptidase domain-containing protein [Oscillospiraceae bacterium]